MNQLRLTSVGHVSIFQIIFVENIGQIWISQRILLSHNKRMKFKAFNLADCFFTTSLDNSNQFW